MVEAYAKTVVSSESYKNYDNGAVSKQLTDVGREGGSDSESVDLLKNYRSTAVLCIYTLHTIV
jgi:hypothetical protein